MAQRYMSVTTYVDIDTGEIIPNKIYNDFKKYYKIIKHETHEHYREFNGDNWKYTTRTNLIRHNGQTTIELV